MRLLIFIIFVFYAFPVAAQEKKSFCIFFDRQCLISREIDALDRQKDRTDHEYSLALRKTAKSAFLGNEATKEKMLDLLNRLGRETQQIAEDRMLLLASLGRISDAISVVRDLQEKGAVTDGESMPQFHVIMLLACTGKSENAFQFAKGVQHIRFKTAFLGNICYAWYPRRKSIEILTETLLADNQPEKAEEAAKLLEEDGIFKSETDSSYKFNSKGARRYCRELLN